MMNNRQCLDDRAQQHGWTRDGIGLFSGNWMTFYTRGDYEVRVETNRWGGLEWLAKCFGNWMTEILDRANDTNLFGTALEWLSEPVGGAA